MNNYWKINAKIFFLILGLVFVTVVLLVVALGSRGQQEDSPCSYYQNWAANDLPARCLKYFNGK